MRKILFRGKHENNGAWVYGCYLTERACSEMQHIIVDENGDYYRINPKTRGEYTGKTDKNGTKIFEGDVCRNGKRAYLICWLDNKYTWGCLNLKTYRKTPIYDVINRYGNNFEVIGNKHDISKLPQDVSELVLNAITPPPFQPVFQPVLKSDDEDFVNFELREG